MSTWDNLKAVADEADAESARWRETAVRFSADYHAELDMRIDAEVQRDSLLASADTYVAEIERLTAENLDLNAEADTYVTEITDLRERIANLRARVANLEAQLTPPLKPGLRGLVTTNPAYVAGNIPYAEFASTKPRWADCNPEPGVYRFGALDNMLATYPDLKFRLRFMAGKHAPDWVKARSGGAIEHNPNTTTGDTGMVPRFWTEEYYQDYMAFMAAIADHFEANPQVVEIPVSITTTIYAEPFILNADPATVTRYWNAGYRFDAVANNLRLSVVEMMALFPTTRISLAGHGKWERIIDGKMNYDWPVLRATYNELIDTYGPRLVLDDHGLGADDTPGVPQPRETATSWYNFMAGLQDTDLTYGWQFTPKDYSMTVAAEMGVRMGARFLEFAGFNAIPEPTRREIHDALLANAEGKP
jgi:hypothetical protein